ncbi:MAG: hypothetical protein ACE14U_02690 [Candidatus Velamenicoccus archaeovorus]
MGNIKEIIVGRDQNAPCVAYGDDSCYEEILTYAFAIVHRVNLKVAESAINEVKSNYCFPNNMSLHCRILFNEAARRKQGLSHIKSEDAQNMILKIISTVNDICLLRYAYFVTPPNFDFERQWKTPFQNANGGDPLNVPIKYDKKGILNLLMNVCFTVPADGKKGPTSEKCQIFVSEDPTRIHFIGSMRRRADSWASGSSDVNAPPGCSFKLDPVVLKSTDAVLLQLADVYSYICAHAHSQIGGNAFFKDALSKIKYKSSGVLNLG